MKRLSLLLEQKKSNKVRPSSVNVVDSFPPRGSLEAADNFQQARGKLFYFYNIGYEKTRSAPHQSTTLTASPQGEAAKRLTIFAEENEGTEFSAGKGKPFLLIYIFVLHHIIIDICQNIE